MKKIIISLAVALTVFINSGFYSLAAAQNGYTYLLMPTQITKINNTYFIVDANHNQIIYSDSLNVELRYWNVMTRNVTGPHAITSDGEIYMVTDTEGARLITFEKTYDGFRQLQVFENVGVRPHYVSYDYESGCFYALSSMTGKMYIYKKTAGTKELVLQEIKDIPNVENSYIRSFTISGDVILFPVIEKSEILVLDKTTFSVIGEYPVSDRLSGMVQISIIGNYFYLTVSTDRAYSKGSSTIVRARSLNDFSSGNYEDLYGLFENKGTPYFISSFNGSFYLIRENASPYIYKMDIENDVIKGVNGIFL